MSEEEKSHPEAGSEETPEAAVPVNVYDTLLWMGGMLGSLAWQKMGLLADPATGEVDKDLAQARAAIDTATFICEKCAPHMSAEDKKSFEGLLNDLKVNYLQQSRE